MANVLVTPSLLKPYNTTILTKADVTNGTGTVAWTTANTGLTLFTVTGLVQARVYGQTTTLLNSTGGTGTLALVGPSAFSIIAATTANGTTNFNASFPWIDTSPNGLSKANAGETLNWMIFGTGLVTLTIATNNMTAGGMTLYCDWSPLSAGATVV